VKLSSSGPKLQKSSPQIIFRLTPTYSPTPLKKQHRPVVTQHLKSDVCLDYHLVDLKTRTLRGEKCPLRRALENSECLCWLFPVTVKFWMFRFFMCLNCFYFYTFEFDNFERSPTFSSLLFFPLFLYSEVIIWDPENLLFSIKS
jgi:hypothetical protein